MNKIMRAANWERDKTLVVQIILDSFEVDKNPWVKNIK